MDRQTKIAIAIFCIVTALIIGLAMFGYFSGRWEIE